MADAKIFIATRWLEPEFEEEGLYAEMLITVADSLDDAVAAIEEYVFSHGLIWVEKNLQMYINSKVAHVLLAPPGTDWED